MTDEPREIAVGYELRRIYLTEQEQELVLGDEEIPSSKDERNFSFFWDWQLKGIPEGTEALAEYLEGDRIAFDIAIGVQVGPVEDDRNRYLATLIGEFRGRVDQPVSLVQFVTLNGVAVLFPYLRQAVTGLSDWSVGERLFLPIINIAALIRGMPMEETQGWDQLEEHPELADRLSINLGQSEAE